MVIELSLCAILYKLLAVCRSIKSIEKQLRVLRVCISITSRLLLPRGFFVAGKNHGFLIKGRVPRQAIAACRELLQLVVLDLPVV